MSTFGREFAYVIWVETQPSFYHVEHGGFVEYLGE